MQIDRTNYEIYFLDYIDGNLAVDLIDEFLEFLECNPDLKDELQSVSRTSVSLPGGNVIFEGKKDLFRNELTGSSEFDYQAIALMEGDLNEEEENLFKKRLEDDPRKQKAFTLITSLRLQPQASISFPEKNKLRKEEKKRSLWIWPLPVAALLILGLLFRTLSPENHTEAISEKKVSEVTPIRPSGEKQTTPSESEVKEQLPVSVNKKLTAQAPVQKRAGVNPFKQISPKEPGKAPMARPKEEPMAELKPIEAEIFPVMATKTSKLARHGQNTQNDSEYTKLTDYLAKKLLDVPKGEPVTLAGIALAGLQVAEDISRKKFSIEKGEEGQIKEISFNSTLFGFSIPVKKNR